MGIYRKNLLMLACFLSANMLHTRMIYTRILPASTYRTNIRQSTPSYEKSYPVDPTIATILDTKAPMLSKMAAEVHKSSQKHGVRQFEWLPGYYVKYGLARISGMEKMQEVIDRCNLTDVTVADKRVYHIKGRPQDLSNLNYLVVIKRVESAHNLPPLTMEEVQQLTTIMHETGYISMTGPQCKKGPNYIRTEDGKLCLIDTESRYDHAQLLKGFLRFLETHDFNRDLSPEALQHIFGEIKELLKEQPENISFYLKEVRKCIKTQKGTPSWDYSRYFKEYFKDLKLQSKPH